MTIIRDIREIRSLILRSIGINWWLFCRLIKEKDIKMISSEDIRVGDVLELHAKDRVPADVVILSTSEHSGSIFIKTDQLDG